MDTVALRRHERRARRLHRTIASPWPSPPAISKMRRARSMYARHFTDIGSPMTWTWDSSPGHVYGSTLIVTRACAERRVETGPSKSGRWAHDIAFDSRL